MPRDTKSIRQAHGRAFRAYRRALHQGSRVREAQGRGRSVDSRERTAEGLWEEYCGAAELLLASADDLARQVIDQPPDDVVEVLGPTPSEEYDRAAYLEALAPVMHYRAIYGSARDLRIEQVPISASTGVRPGPRGGLNNARGSLQMRALFAIAEFQNVTGVPGIGLPDLERLELFTLRELMDHYDQLDELVSEVGWRGPGHPTPRPGGGGLGGSDSAVRAEALLRTAKRLETRLTTIRVMRDPGVAETMRWADDEHARELPQFSPSIFDVQTWAGLAGRCYALDVWAQTSSSDINAGDWDPQPSEGRGAATPLGDWLRYPMLTRYERARLSTAGVLTQLASSNTPERPASTLLPLEVSPPDLSPWLPVICDPAESPARTAEFGPDRIVLDSLEIERPAVSVVVPEGVTLQVVGVVGNTISVQAREAERRLGLVVWNDPGGRLHDADSRVRPARVIAGADSNTEDPALFVEVDEDARLAAIARGRRLFVDLEVPYDMDVRVDAERGADGVRIYDVLRASIVAEIDAAPAMHLTRTQAGVQYVTDDDRVVARVGVTRSCPYVARATAREAHSGGRWTLRIEDGKGFATVPGHVVERSPDVTLSIDPAVDTRGWETSGYDIVDNGLARQRVQRIGRDEPPDPPTPTQGPGPTPNSGPYRPSTALRPAQDAPRGRSVTHRRVPGGGTSHAERPAKQDGGPDASGEGPEPTNAGRIGIAARLRDALAASRFVRGQDAFGITSDDDAPVAPTPATPAISLQQGKGVGGPRAL